MATEERPHIVVVPFPAQGHLPPMVHLSRHLAARGFTVTLVNLESVHGTLTNKWKGSLQSGLDIRFEKLQSSLNMPFGFDASSSDKWCLEMELVEKEFEQLLAKIRPRPRCVISDYFLYLGVSVSTRMGIPAVSYFPGSAAYSSIHHHIDLLMSNGDLDSCEENKVIRYIPGIKELKSEDVPAYLRVEKHREWMQPDSRCMLDCDWILVNSFEELEAATSQAMREVLRNKRFVPVAPLFELVAAPVSHGSLREENMDCIEWLDSRAPGSVLFISFGSLSILSEESVEQLAKGLEDSKQPFLWVVRQDIIQKGPQLDSQLYKEFIRRTEGQGLIVSWAPQLKVLAHPATGGFLSHCGWNSVMESLCSGIPLLCSPCLAEQVLNAKMVIKDFKMGMEYEGTRAAGVIEKFMAGEGEDVVAMRSRTLEFKSMAQAAASEGGSSYTNLNKFMDDMMHP